MDNRTYTVDSGITSAIDLFITYGCQPGSCTSLLLQGKYARANEHAHVMIKHGKVWEDHVGFVKYIVPKFVKGKNFDTWKGFTNPIQNEVGEYIMLEKLVGQKYISDLYDKFNRGI